MRYGVPLARYVPLHISWRWRRVDLEESQQRQGYVAYVTWSTRQSYTIYVGAQCTMRYVVDFIVYLERALDH